tara:strand:+ start:1795 stop:3114 length:1320 start_codon:yes stop_codon:yes gene_type:complete
MNKILIILGLLLSLNVYAEEQITGNLITNGTFENNNSNGWTTTGNVQVLNDCCGSNYDLEFGDYGSIEQTFELANTPVTQSMLDNGVTLNSSVQVQNGECAVSGCWGGQGPADTFTIRLQIQDADSSVLATTTTVRTNVTGINGKNFTDSVTYTGTGSNLGNIFISGSDGNAPNTLGGPNLDNISVTMTYDDEVLTTSQVLEIVQAASTVEEVIELIEFSPIIEETVFEIIEIEPEIVEELIVLTLAPEEEIQSGVIELIEEPVVETVETIEESTVIEEPITELETEGEEIYEELTVEEEPVSQEETVSQTEEEPGEELRTTDTGGEGSTGRGDTGPDETTSQESVAVLRLDEVVAAVTSKLPKIEDQLKAVHYIVAKAMTSNNTLLNQYSIKNQNLFANQPTFDGGNIDSYIAQSYVDIRQIYSNVEYPDRSVDWTSR